MRLQLIRYFRPRPLNLRGACFGALALVLAGASPARAQTSFASKVQVYVDNDRTQVVSPLVRAQADVTPTTNVTAGYVVDIVTSASIDLVTQASARTIHDVRHQGSLGASQILGDWSVNGGYVYSTENDYASHGLNAGLERRLFNNNTTLAGGYALSLNQVGRAGDLNFERDLQVHTLGGTWTQMLTPHLATQVTYTFAAADGYQASPYRFVPVRASRREAARLWVPESDPLQRYKHGITIGANLYLGSDTSLQGDYRFYRDTWDIVSHTLQVRYLVDLADRFELRVRNRFYTQSAASFYRGNYGEVLTFMTIDRELGALWSEMFGFKLGWKVIPTLELEAKAELFYFSYADFAALPSRMGANIALGATLTY